MASKDKQDPARREKPSISKKSDLVLALATDLIQLRHQANERSHSDSEIYDDILSVREWDDDIYDDVVLYRLQCSPSKSENKNESEKASIDQTTDTDLSRTSSKKSQKKSRPLPKPDLSKLLPTSYEDIYDDVVVYRMRKSESSHKPEVPPKPSHLYHDPRVRKMLKLQKQKKAAEEIEEIYDATISLFPYLQVAEDESSVQLEEVYIDPVSITQGTSIPCEAELESSPVRDYEQPYSAPELVQESSVSTKTDDGNPYEIESLFEEITTTANASQSCSNLPQLRVNDDNNSQKIKQTTIATSSKLTVRKKSATLPHQHLLPAHRTRFDPLPDILRVGSLTKHLSIQYSDSEEEYEQLALYEDVQKYQEDTRDYEDLDQAIIEALDLPKQIRGRTARLVRGTKKRKLHKTIKQRKTLQHLGILHVEELKVSSTSDIDSYSESGSRIHEDSEIRSQSEPALERNSSITETSSNVTPSIDDDQLEQDHTQRNTENTEASEDEDDSIPIGKSREIFEMLLDASDIRRIPTHSKRRHSLFDAVDTQEDDDQHDFLNTFDFKRLEEAMTAELKDYKDAGIVQLRSRSQIEEEIKRLTDTAPSEPPPLPGVVRPRSRLVTRSDVARHERVLLKRRHTYVTT